MEPARIRLESITYRYSSGENRTIYRTIIEHLDLPLTCLESLSRNWEILFFKGD